MTELRTRVICALIGVVFVIQAMVVWTRVGTDAGAAASAEGQSMLLGVGPLTMLATDWTTPVRRHHRPATRPAVAVAEARRQVGKPYRAGGVGPDSFDCSGLTLWAWRAAGVTLPHSAPAQYRLTRPVAVHELQPGDLVFYYAGLGHVGMYVGDGNMIEAPRSGLRVRLVPLRRENFVAGGRVLPGAEPRRTHDEHSRAEI